eukprot:jgi/Tetstr1/437546/TSEL_026218.t1
MAASSTAQPPGVVKTLAEDKKRKRPVKKRRGKKLTVAESEAEAEAEAARSSKRRVPRARKNKNKRTGGANATKAPPVHDPRPHPQPGVEAEEGPAIPRAEDGRRARAGGGGCVGPQHVPATGPHATTCAGHSLGLKLKMNPKRISKMYAKPCPCSAKATESEGNSGTGSSTGLYRGGLDPSLEQAVPRDQRPANELQAIKEASLYNWALKGNTGYIVRLLALYSLTFGLIGGPISYQTFDPAVQPLEFFLSGSTGSLLVVSVAVLRMYLGWSYVGNRLLSASVAYEETGWYDGQVFVKPQEVLARDRLLGTYEAKPALAKLKTSLTVCAVALLSCAGTLTICINNGTDADGVYGRGAAQPRKVTANGIIYSSQEEPAEEFANTTASSTRETNTAAVAGTCIAAMPDGVRSSSGTSRQHA